MKKSKNRLTTAAGNMPIDSRKRQERILDILGMMKHKDLIRACVSRGLDFQNVVDWDHNKLGSFFLENFDTTEDPNLLDAYDRWIQVELEKRGYVQGDAILSPFLRIGFVGKGDLEELPTKIVDPTVKMKKVQESVRVEKPKREKDEVTGVVAGTKKNMTYTLAKQGKDLPKVIELVKKQFPEAEEKSIKIWYKRCLKEMGEDGNN
jgi:hypothetical protein